MWFLKAKRRKAAEAKSAAFAERALEARRANLPAYRRPLDLLANATGRPTDDVWQAFCRGFLLRGSINEGLENAFAADARHFSLDWKDSESFTYFSQGVSALFPAAAPFEFHAEGLTDPVESGLRALARWLHARDHALVNIGSDSDTYSCFVLRRDAAEALVREGEPPGMRVFDLLHSRYPPPEP